MREEQKQFQSSKICWVCEKLIDDDNLKVRDHCHLTNKFIGAAHRSCNMNSSLDKLVKNLSDDDFKYLTQEFSSKNLELLKKKDAYPYEDMDSFQRFGEEKLPDRECFYNSVKDRTTDDNGKKLDGHISDENYLM